MSNNPLNTLQQANQPETYKQLVRASSEASQNSINLGNSSIFLPGTLAIGQEHNPTNLPKWDTLISAFIPCVSPNYYSLSVEQIISNYQAKVWLLEHSLVIYVPTTIDVNTPLDTSMYVEQAKNLMAELFEGISWVEQGGMYKSALAGMVSENNFLVKSFMTRQALEKHLPAVLNFVGYLQKQLRQETMALEIDGKMVLLQID